MTKSTPLPSCATAGSTTAAPPFTGAETFNEDTLVSSYEQFAWAQQFTLLEPLPAPVFLDLLNVIIERELDPEVRARAMRIAAGVAEWCHEQYMRAFVGYDVPNGPPESEAASRDPHEVERHLILTASLALEVGDPQFPGLAASWMGIGTSVAEREAYFNVIECPEKVLRIIQTEAPGQFLRASVHGRVEDRERLRPQRARGRRVLSINDESYQEAVAECGIDAPTPFIETVLDLLRSRPGKKPARLASIIERMRNGGGKADLGTADYQYLRDNVEMLVRLVNGIGITRRPETPDSGRRSPMSTQPWVRQRIAGLEVVEHRYSAEDIEIYGTVTREAFERLTKNSSYFSSDSGAAK